MMADYVPSRKIKLILPLLLVMYNKIKYGGDRNKVMVLKINFVLIQDGEVLNSNTVGRLPGFPGAKGDVNSNIINNDSQCFIQ